jgi:PBSX family phage terminase large subunit
MNISRRQISPSRYRPKIIAAPKGQKINFKQRAATRIAVRSTLGLEDYSFILFGGAIRGGKSFWGFQTLIYLCELYPRSRWIVLRKDLRVIRDNTIPSFKKFLEELVPNPGVLKESPYNYKHPNGSEILFRGENRDKDPELNKFKGFEGNGFLLEEMNELGEKTLDKSFERAGSWIIPGIDQNEQPRPIILATCNPSQGWVKSKIYTPWKNNALRSGWLYIPSYIWDNPFLPAAYLESVKNMSDYEYRVFVLGDWDVVLKSGGEFLKEFELDRHLGNEILDPSKTIHISIDSNVRPYIAVSLWQFYKKPGRGWKIIQVAELPVREPNNSAINAGKMVRKFLEDYEYKNKIFLYGDPTTKAANNIDDNKRSFLTLFKTAVKEGGFEISERFFSRAPNVSLTGDFINEILAREIFNLSIEINEGCKDSINDYIQVKEDADGGIFKKRIKDPITGVMFEPLGHLTDTMRYLICKAFEEEFVKYSQRFADYSRLSETTPDPESFLKGGF